MRNKLISNKEYVRLDGMSDNDVKVLLTEIEQTKIKVLPFIGKASDYNTMVLRRAAGAKGAPIGIGNNLYGCSTAVTLREFKKRLEARRVALNKLAKKAVQYARADS